MSSMHLGESEIREFISLVLSEDLSSHNTRAFSGTGASHSYNSKSDAPGLGDPDPFDVKEEEVEDTSKIRISKVFSKIKESKGFISDFSDDIDYSKNPDKYISTRNSQGVYIVEPYKSDLLPIFKFSSPEKSKRSASRLFNKFLDYKKDNDFVGMDMVRKYLQLGFNLSSRFSKFASGKRDQMLPDRNNKMAASKKFFMLALKKVMKDEKYIDFIEK